MQNDLERAYELIELIKKYDKQYYEDGVSEISDAEYDRLYDEYLELENRYSELKNNPDSPTKRVGAGKEANTTVLPKFTHKSPLLSIDRKSKNLEDLKKFYEDCGGDGTEVIIEPKLDGITCNINYENGVFANAATRGNGYIGDLITENFKMTDTLYPKSLSNNENLEIRGEAIIPYDFFKKKLSKEYSNPRNAVSGIMRQIDPKSIKDKGVRVMFYDIGTYSNIMFEDSDYDRVDFIKLLGFNSVPVIMVDNYSDLEKVVNSKMNGMIQNIDGFNVLTVPKDEKHNLEYPKAVCDGLVIKVNSHKKREEIGYSLKGPKWAFAYKFKPLQAETTINYVEWQVGKSGVVTPVAVFDKISLGGTNITKATLNNYDYMRNMPTVDNYGNIDLEHRSHILKDDTIIVERANDVIPRIVAIKNHNICSHSKDNAVIERIEKETKTFFKPSVCPVCGSELHKEDALLYCINPTCSAQIKGKIEHFASRDAMNIVGLGESIVDLLYEKGLLKSIDDIYKLPQKRSSLEKLEGFGKKKIDNLFKSIENSKNPELWQFIYALSIPNIGKRSSKDLANYFHNIGKLMSSTYEQLINIEGFADNTINTMLDYIYSENFVEMINRLLEYISPRQIQLNSNEFSGKTFVITGTLLRPRDYYQKIIESKGGKVSNSVSKKTYAVLIGKDAGSKAEKAYKFKNDGINIIILEDERHIEDFLKIESGE